MNKALYTVAVFAKISTKRFFRDKLAIFFTVIFPLIFLFVFGWIFGGSSEASFNVALINQSDSAFAKDFDKMTRDSKVFKVDKDVTTFDAAKAKMIKSQIDGIIVLPPDFGKVQQGKTVPSGEAQLLYGQNSGQTAQALVSVLDSQFNSINSKFVDTSVPFAVKPVQLNERSLSPFDYTFAGLLGFAIIGMGIFGPINVFPELKKMGILRRLSTTPIRVWQYFMATAISQMIIGVVSLAVMFIVAITVFKLKIVGNYFELTAFLLFGIVTILGIGLALGGWAKNERQAAPLSNIIVFPMMFLSGTFFPRFLMPEWLQHISALLPLTPVIDGVRLIVTEGKHLIDITPQLGLMGIWVVVIYAIAFKVFRWE